MVNKIQESKLRCNICVHYSRPTQCCQYSQLIQIILSKYVRGGGHERSQCVLVVLCFQSLFYWLKKIARNLSRMICYDCKIPLKVFCDHL